MERGRVRKRCAAWGSAALGVGTLAYALCSPSNAGCSTNLVVLTHATVTARGCAAYSLAARLGVGLMVLGAVLLLGSFILTVRIRRQGTTEVPVTAVRRDDEHAERARRSAVTQEEPRPRATAGRVGPIPPGGDGPGWTEAAPTEAAPAAPVTEPPVTLPPGWYGNPDNPDSPVQWWDGTKLTDRRPGSRR